MTKRVYRTGEGSQPFVQPAVPVTGEHRGTPTSQPHHPERNYVLHAGQDHAGRVQADLDVKSGRTEALYRPCRTSRHLEVSAPFITRSSPSDAADPTADQGAVTTQPAKKPGVGSPSEATPESSQPAATSANAAANLPTTWKNTRGRTGRRSCRSGFSTLTGVVEHERTRPESLDR